MENQELTPAQEYYMYFVSRMEFPVSPLSRAFYYEGPAFAPFPQHFRRLGGCG